MTNDAKHLIDLTGPASHTLTREPGVGLLRLGPASQGKQADLHVEAHLPLNWHAFDAFTTPAGSPWPRALYYTGSDEGVFAWARQRPIETLHWTPILTQDTRIDASHSAIQILAVDLSAPGAHLHLTLPGQQTDGAHRHLSLKGDLTRLSIDGDLPCSLDLAPATLARTPPRLSNCRTWAPCIRSTPCRCTTARWRSRFHSRVWSALRSSGR